MKVKTEDIRFDLLENGLDFIDNSLKPILESKNLHELKYSILHLSSGIELILKEILKNEHWSLVFEDPNKANLKLMESGDFQSVIFDTLIKRLQNIVGLNLDTEIKHIRSIRRRRNKIEHFKCDEKVAAIKSVVSKALSEILEIIRDNIDLDNYSKNSRDIYENILKKAAKFEEFTSLTYSKLEKKLKDYTKHKIPIINCPECFQPALPLDQDYKCLFCGYSDTVENVMDAYIEKILEISIHYNIKTGGEIPNEECPECKSDTLVFNNKGYICFSCCNEWDIRDLNRCESCSCLYEKSLEDIDICSDCIAWKMAD